MATKALNIKNLNKSFGETHVLKDVSVSINKGDFLVLVGPSGCGKSTLLNCIAGLEEISSGILEISGRDVVALSPRERDIAMVFQSYALYPTMSIRENIEFGMKIRSVPKEEINTQVLRVATLLQIEHLLDRRPGQLSGGQRQRVAMGRALVREPALFLFDEPLSNLDAKLRMEMRAEIKQMHAKTGTTIVYVTHDQIEAMTMATNIVVMKDGVIQQVGTPDEIYRHPANTFVADFMGAPPMNLIDVKVDGNSIQFPDDQVIEGIQVPLEAQKNGRAKIGIRPEVFSLGQQLTVKPRIVEHTGADLFLTFDMANEVVTARLPWATIAQDEIGLSIDLNQLRFFSSVNGTAIS
ncbi:ABC transporter ATP-binding protein [Pseudovibrio brasiliensis]|uniref:Sn-glycerol-3-phosphate ABC transporter ATP-binding protein UgpC n=1 Tax=Pseudovibrio brasiliensis TaxID=1898042 RepID=A0ABX8AU86_9HYPH|nr:sn-glycerol-3-phosphate ABC transporter ATP-binding protein UgpC [Pseudovibrio brasiliensis]QUS58257.1 sn-glycerol-3-phosphate ABC transporter ATP-binding protein UgpC [Pseudovibrio brasiliensis]